MRRWRSASIASSTPPTSSTSCPISSSCAACLSTSAPTTARSSSPRPCRTGSPQSGRRPPTSLPAVHGRTATSRASTRACATNSSTARSSTRSKRPGSSWKAGGGITTPCVRMDRSATSRRHPRSSSRHSRGRPCNPNQQCRPRWRRDHHCTNNQIGPVRGGRSKLGRRDRKWIVRGSESPFLTRRGGWARGRQADAPAWNCEKAAEPGLRGRSGEPDIETISSAPIGLDQLAPFRLRLEQVRHARAGRAGFGQNCLAMLPGKSAHGCIMKNAHDARLDLPEHEGPSAENDLAEIVPVLEDDLGCSPCAAQPVLGFGTITPLAPADKFLLADQEPFLGLQHDTIAILRGIEVNDPEGSLVKQPVGIMGAQVLESMEGGLIIGNVAPLTLVDLLIAALLEVGAIEANRYL